MATDASEAAAAWILERQRQREERLAGKSAADEARKAERAEFKRARAFGKARRHATRLAQIAQQRLC